jgi:hypothetical protein
MSDVIAIKGFEPGVFITINDVMTGVRKLARVTETGHAYHDLDTDTATAFPIWETLDPQEAGNILGWGLFFVDQEPQHHDAFSALCKKLVASGEGFITYNRAAYWAFHNRNFDFAAAMEAAKKETDAIQQGRKSLEQMVINARGAA